MSEIVSDRAWSVRFARNATGYIGDECLEWPYSKDKNGYGRVRIDGRSTSVNRYVCEIVHGLPPSPKYDAAHSCGNRACVNPAHLEWKTHKDNCADKVLHNTHNRGERHPDVKVTQSDVQKIISLRGIRTQEAIASEFGITQSNVSRIQSGNTWAWLSTSIRTQHERACK